MKTYQFKALFQNTGWVENACVSVDEMGIIAEISNAISHDKPVTSINGYAIPGFQNAHSHAFQYAMAGLAERHPHSVKDDFWGWREAMYQLALSIDPDQMESIATMLYSEMVRHGYTHVAEFHYLHHDKSGKPFTNLAEMGGRIVNAAKTAGIGITLVPIFYQKGGFGLPATERQRRFISSTPEEYLKLLEASVDVSKTYEHANAAIGIHSLRGVEPKITAEVLRSSFTELPKHIHVSEQLKEIEDCVAYLGKRPVEWLLENLGLNKKYNLVHATHLTEAETVNLARSGANVVLCPTTEGNLGDGLFPLQLFQMNCGSWSIGTDSHIGINPLEELRLLDYGQRLTTHQRNIFGSEDETDAGAYAIKMATVAGRRAMGNFETGFFKVGQPLNACIIDASSPLIASSSLKNLCSTIVYASGPDQQWGTICNGELKAERGKHVDHSVITQNFVKTIKELKNR